MQLGQSLLALMSLELGPELQMLIEQSQSLLVVLRQANFLPELLGEVGALYCFHVEVAVAFVFEHGGVPAVGEGARVARAQTRQVVLIAAESLLHGPCKNERNRR